MISDADIDRHAIDVLKKLKQAGFEAYLVGGCVRDLLLKHRPKDFDIATNAHPNEIKDLFRNCRLIGRRFRLAHIFFGRDIIEVATFRGPHDATEEHVHASGLIMRDNVYGTLEEDAWRRDFTINAFYFDVESREIKDHVKGMDDLQNQLIRIIGDPTQRYREDPVRMLRAIRFAAKLDFEIEKETRKPINHLSELLLLVSPARLFEEVVKLFHSGSAHKTYLLLKEHQLFSKLFPMTTQVLDDKKMRVFFEKLLETTFGNTDQRISEGKTVTPAFLFAVLLWYPVKMVSKSFEKQHVSPAIAFEEAMREVLAIQQKHTTIPKYLTTAMREIWLLQHRLLKRQGKTPLKLLSHPRFRAGYDLLLLRARAGEIESGIVDWWTHFQTLSPEQQEEFVRKKSRSKSTHNPKKQIT